MTTEASSDSVIGDAQGDETFRLVPIAAEVNELPRSAAQHELPTTPLAPARHLIDDDIEAVGRRVGGERYEHSIAGRGALPASRDFVWRVPSLDTTGANGGRVGFGHEQPSAARVAPPNEQFHTVAVDVGRLVVIGIGRIASRERAIAARHVDDDVERTSLPREHDGRRWLAGLLPRLLGAAVVPLGEVEVDRPSERWQGRLGGSFRKL